MAVTAVAGLLVRGEARAQGLVASRAWVTAAQGVLLVGCVVLVATRARAVLVDEAPDLAQTALLTVGLTGVLAVNVVVLGRQTGTDPRALLRWSRRQPWTHDAALRLLAALGVGRVLLFSAVLVVLVLAAAVPTAPSAGVAVAALALALVMPVLPVAAGLWWTARHDDPVAPVVILVPVTVLLLGLFGPRVDVPAALEPVVRLLAVPGLSVLGRTPLATMLAVLVVWLLGAALLMAYLDPARATTVRPPFASSLVAARGSRWTWLLTLWAHRLRPSTILLLLTPGVLGAWVVLTTGAAAAARGAGLVVSCLLVGFAVAVVGHGQAMAATALDTSALRWLATVPVDPGASALAAHTVRVLGAAVAMLPVAAVVAAVPDAPAVARTCAAVLVLLTPVAVGGWLAMSRGSLVTQVVAATTLGAFLLVRAGTWTLAGLTGRPASILAAIAVDVLAGTLGAVHVRRSARAVVAR